MGLSFSFRSIPPNSADNERQFSEIDEKIIDDDMLV